ncbi:hypothetical protein TGRH88_053760 [Toxoplasma gondii]|uniref:Uncharacterized protein n=1 Tax=Toxoplasma gondii TaxID=5811 RepID=A0A7J6JXY1_TOXGO|nr:hypothetical protein TGRH88_053760 [Toxoplasma gondii]
MCRNFHAKDLLNNAFHIAENVSGAPLIFLNVTKTGTRPSSSPSSVTSFVVSYTKRLGESSVHLFRAKWLGDSFAAVTERKPKKDENKQIVERSPLAFRQTRSALPFASSNTFTPLLRPARLSTRRPRFVHRPSI